MNLSTQTDIISWRQRSWSVRFSYLPLPMQDRKRWRQNGQVGVIASTIEEAIAATKSRAVADGAEAVTVWSAQDRGPIDIICTLPPTDEPSQE